MSIIGGCSKVVQDVPPYMMADGNPARTRPQQSRLGAQRCFDEAQVALKQALRILFRAGLIQEKAIATIESELPPLPEVKHLLDFIRGSKRGIAK